jgi:hypothetical protein
LPPEVEFFQIHSALRLLAQALAIGHSDPHEILAQWLEGAELILQPGRRGIVPINVAFMDLV